MKLQANELAAALLAVSFAAGGCRKEGAAAATASGATSAAAPTVAAAPAPSRLPAAMTQRGAGSTSTSRRSTSMAKTAQPPAARRETTATPRGEVSNTETSNGSTAPAAEPVAPAGPSALDLALGRLPFHGGERLEYQVKFGFLAVGSATLQVLGLDSVRGTPTVHAQFIVQGGIRIYRVNDRYESWFDPRSFNTLRTIQHIDEGSYDRDRHYEMYPERQMMSENGKPDTATVPDPLDEATFLFFLRTIPLEVGQTYQFNRYFKPDRNPVTVVVERKEQVKVPAGTFNTIVVRPVIKTSGIFGEGGRAEIWFTDDSTRTLVQLKSKLKFGSLNLYLRSRQAGAPWTGAAPSP